MDMTLKVPGQDTNHFLTISSTDHDKSKVQVTLGDTTASVNRADLRKVLQVIGIVSKEG